MTTTTKTTRIVGLFAVIIAFSLREIAAKLSKTTTKVIWTPFAPTRRSNDATRRKRELVNLVQDSKNVSDGVLVIDASSTVIDGQVVWTKSNTPVIRIEGGMLNITENASLTIRRGVRVLFAGRHSGIRNAGLLRILGHEKDRVTLQTIPSSKEDDEALWRGIIFNETAAGAVVKEAATKFGIPAYVRGSIIQSTDIHDAAVEFKRRYPEKTQAVLQFDYGNPPYLRDVSVLDCTGHCLRVFRLTGAFVASDVHLKIKEIPRRYSYQELFVQGRRKGPLTSGNVFLRRVTAVNDDKTDESILQGLQSVTIQDSAFDEMRLTRVNDTASAEESRKCSRLSSSQFLHGLSLGAVHGAILEKNFFGEAERPPTRAFYGTAVYASQVSDFLMQNNTFEHTGPVTVVPAATTATTSAIDGKKPAVRVTSNTFRNLRVRDGLFNLWSVPDTDDAHFICDVSDNFVDNSTIGSMLTLSKSEGDATQGYCRFRENIFANSNNATHSVVAVQGFTFPVAEAVRVPRNYWGIFQNDIVKAKRRSVQDVLTTTQGAFVDFHSVRAKPNGRVKLVDGVEGPFLSNGSLGGFHVGNKRIVLENLGVVKASFSLVVSTDATLVIGSNVDIQFPTGAGLVALDNGVIDISGGGASSTKLRPEDKDGFVVISAQTSAPTTIRGVRLEGLVKHSGTGPLLIHRSTLSYDSKNWREPECVRSSLPIDDEAQGMVTITKSILETCSVKVERRPVVAIRNTRIGRDSQLLSISKEMQIEKCRFEGDLNVEKIASSDPASDLGSELRVTDSSFVRGYVRVAKCGADHILVEGNDFTTFDDPDNPCGGLDIDVARKCVSDIVFRKNTLHDMKCTSAIAPVQLYFDPPSPGKYGGFVIQDNEFRGVSAGRMFYLNVYSTMNPFNVGGNYFDGDCVSTASRFAAGLVVFRFWPEDCSGVGSDVPLCTFRNNTFETSKSGTSFQLASVWDTDAKIDASYNYWGHEDSTIIGNRMGKDRYHQGAIRFEPFRLSPEAGNGELFPPCAEGNDCGGFGGVCVNEAMCVCDDGKTRKKCSAR